MSSHDESYVIWNYMLDEQFLTADTPDGVVQLPITPHTLAKAVRETTGEVRTPKEAEESLAEAVSAVYASRVLRSPRKLLALTSTDPNDVPFATGFLALSVLAAYHMEKDDERSALAFYPRLAKMLGCPLSGTYPDGFAGDAFLKLWNELDHWLITRRGRRLAKPDPETTKPYIAVPFAHVPLRQVDRVRLFFVDGPISLSGGGEAGGNWIRQGVVRSGGGSGGRRYFCRQRPMGDFRWSSRAS